MSTRFPTWSTPFLGIEKQKEYSDTDKSHDHRNFEDGKGRRQLCTHCRRNLNNGSPSSRDRMLILTLLIALQWSNHFVSAGKSSSSSSYDTGIFGANLRRDYLTSSSSISIVVEGCVWGYTADSNQANMGCLENSSNDGTTLWYKMANCRRAQVAYSIYASSTGSTSCSDKEYKETVSSLAFASDSVLMNSQLNHRYPLYTKLVTKDGVAEFAYAVGNYGTNAPIDGNSVANLPLCEGDGSGYYLSVGCSTTGTFTIDRFTDKYCLKRYDTYDTLKNMNSAMSKMKNCFSCYSKDSNDDSYSNLCTYLISNSGGCSQYDCPICKSSSFIKNAGSASSLVAISSGVSTLNSAAIGGSFLNSFKYGAGAVMLFGALVLFIGILFTNRRKRRALMHRKLRDSVSKSRSKSRSRASSSKARTRSSSRRVARDADSEDDGGIFA